MKDFYKETEVADILGISKRSLARFKNNLFTQPEGGKISYELLKDLEPFKKMENSKWNKEYKTKPKKQFTLIELFAGAGGLAIGLHKSGFKSLLLNDFDRDSCETLKSNTNWNVVHDDVANLDLSEHQNKVDVLSEGSPATFSICWKKRGFEDTRGTLFMNLQKEQLSVNQKLYLLRT